MTLVIHNNLGSFFVHLKYPSKETPLQRNENQYLVLTFYRTYYLRIFDWILFPSSNFFQFLSTIFFELLQKLIHLVIVKIIVDFQFSFWFWFISTTLSSSNQQKISFLSVAKKNEPNSLLLIHLSGSKKDLIHMVDDFDDFLSPLKIPCIIHFVS